jgi:hypothetical protein
VSSEDTIYKKVRYNCVALAADGDFTIWWAPSTLNSKPVKRPGFYWPDGIPTDASIESYIMLFKLLGYATCADFNDRVEMLYEKIAIFGYPGDNEFSHVAYQLYFGWISKLGEWQDIKHRNLQGLKCDDYGQPMVIMKRRCSCRGFLARAFFNQIARIWPVNWRDSV